MKLGEIENAVQKARRQERIDKAKVAKVRGGARSSVFEVGIPSQQIVRDKTLNVSNIVKGESENFFFNEQKKAVGFDQGYGNIGLRPEAQEELVTRLRRRGVTQPQLAAVLEHTNMPVQVSSEGTTSVSGSLKSSTYIDKQADSILKMASGDLDLRGSKVGFLDIETGGLSEKFGITQVAINDVNVKFQNPMMQMGVSFKDGKFQPFEEGAESLMSGMKTILRELNEMDALVAQNAAFDLKFLLSAGESLVGLGDKEFEALWGVGKKKLLGETADIVDTLPAMKLLRPELKTNSATRGAFSQQVMSSNTSLLQDAYEANLLSKDDIKALVSGKAHDAALDIKVTKAIGVLSQDIVSGSEYTPAGRKVNRKKGKRSGSKMVPSSGKNPDELLRMRTEDEIADFLSGVLGIDKDQAIKGVHQIRDSAADVASAKLPGLSRELTGQQALVEGTRDLSGQLGDISKLSDDDFYRGVVNVMDAYDPSQLVDGAAGLTPETMGGVSRRGLMNPSFARTLSIGDEVHSMEEISGLKGSAVTVQEAYAKAGVAFAGAAEEERMLGSLINRGVGRNTVSNFAQTHGSALGATYFDSYSEPMRKFGSGAIAMDPVLANALVDDLADLEVNRGLVGGRKALRLSHTGGNSAAPRVTAIMDVLHSGGDEALRNRQQAQIVSRFDEVFDGFGDLAELKDLELDKATSEYLETVGKRLGVSTEEAERMLGRDRLASRLQSMRSEVSSGSLRHGIQVGSVQSAEAAQFLEDVQGGARRDFSDPGRADHRVVLLDDADGTLKTSMPVKSTAEGLSRVEGLTENVERLDKTVKTAERVYEEKGLAGKIVASANQPGRGGDVGGWAKSIDKYFSEANNVTNFKRGSAVGIALGVAGLLYKRERSQAKYEETMSVSGYQTENDYRDYKTSIGEAPSAAFAVNPMSRMQDPLESAGFVQNLHDMKTQRTNMDTSTKYGHLFGR